MVILVYKSSEAFVFIPRLFTPNWKIQVIRSDGTTDDITNDLIYTEFDLPVTESIGQFKIILDNNRDTYTELYNGGETVKIYLDMTNATDKKFEGILEHVKRVDGDYGVVLELTGMHIAGKLVDITVVESYADTKIEDILADLVSTYASGFTYSKATYPCATTATVNWEHQGFWTCIYDLCVLAGYDCYVDVSKAFHFFPQNSITSVLEAVVYGPTLLETEGLGEDTADVKNRIIVYGEDDKGLPIIYTSSDTSSQSSYNVKEKIIKDSSIKTMAQAKERGDAELDELKEPMVKGMPKCLGMPDINPGDLVWVSIPPLGLHNKYRVLNATHIIDKGDFTTELELSKPTKGFSYQFKQQTKADLVSRAVLNPNRLEFSYNFTFDDDTNCNHENTATKDGYLYPTAATGIMTSIVKTASNNIQYFELRYEGENLESSTFDVSTDDGLNWQTNISKNILKTAEYTGKKLIVRINLSGTSSKVYSLALLYK